MAGKSLVLIHLSNKNFGCALLIPRWTRRETFCMWLLLWFRVALLMLEPSKENLTSQEAVEDFCAGLLMKLGILSKERYHLHPIHPNLQSLVCLSCWLALQFTSPATPYSLFLCCFLSSATILSPPSCLRVHPRTLRFSNLCVCVCINGWTLLTASPCTSV